MQTREFGRATASACLLPVLMLFLTSLGCENQQPVIDSLQQEKVEVEQQLAKASEQATQLATENTAMQQGLEAAKKVAQQAAQEVQDAVKQAQAAAETKLAEAKKQASEALATATADAKAQVIRAEQEAQKLVAEANTKIASLQKQLDEAKARIAELEAAPKPSGTDQ